MYNLFESRKNIGCIRDWHINSSKWRHFISNIKCLHLHRHQELYVECMWVAPRIVTIKIERVSVLLLLRIDKLAILQFVILPPTSRQYSIPQWQLTFTSTVYKHTPCEKGNENCQPTMRFIIHVWEPCGPTQLVGESVKFMCILQSYQHAKTGTIDASSPTAGYCYSVCCQDVDVDFYHSMYLMV